MATTRRTAANDAARERVAETTGAETTGAEGSQRPAKQAVVIIHGMGEQHPMGTLRGFVDTVWAHVDWRDQARRDATGTDEPGSPDATAPRPWWIKPDSLSGMHELRRITTGSIGAAQGTDPAQAAFLNDRRTDFFEFYWADLMQGTTRAHVLSWVSRLLLRVPLAVPRQVLAVWLFLWTALILAATVLGVAALREAGFLTGCDPAALQGIENWRCFAVHLTFWLKLGFGALVAVAAFVAAALLLRLTGKGIVQIGRPQVWTTLVLAALTLIVWVPTLWAVLIAEAPAVDGPPLRAFETATFNTFVAVAFAVVLYFGNHFLKTYFGDVARYVTASPANVEKRKAIRDRGLTLLRQLHDCGRYDRIVVVGHSLGSIVAYDLINLLWAQIGPSPSRPIDDAARAAFDDLDRRLCERRAQPAPERAPAFLRTLRRHQRAIAARLIAQTRRAYPLREDEKEETMRWLITDLVTLGSPLTHADFLLARSSDDVDRLIAERSLSVCPPILEKASGDASGQRDYSFLYRVDGEGPTYPHHASCFAAVRWTNIYDPPGRVMVLSGDLVSGPVDRRFGHDVRTVDRQHDADGDETVHDIAVRIEREGAWFPRLFTHTDYWRWRDDFNGAVPHHIQALRDALRLAEPPPDGEKAS